jgi:hypothetical protein
MSSTRDDSFFVLTFHQFEIPIFTQFCHLLTNSMMPDQFSECAIFELAQIDPLLVRKLFRNAFIHFFVSYYRSITAIDSICMEQKDVIVFETRIAAQNLLVTRVSIIIKFRNWKAGRGIEIRNDLIQRKWCVHFLFLLIEI